MIEDVGAAVDGYARPLKRWTGGRSRPRFPWLVGEGDPLRTWVLAADGPRVQAGD